MSTGKSKSVTCAAPSCRKVAKGRSKYCSEACKKKSSRKSSKKTQSKSKLVCSLCPNPISYGNKSGLCRSCKSLVQIEHRKQNLHLCAAADWLIKKVLRHTTVECLPRDKQGMIELLALRSQIFKANGLYFNDEWEIDHDKSRFEICHRFPCQHKDGRIGMFVRDNLVIAPKNLNRRLGNRLVCENGLWLDRRKLDPHFKVRKGMDFKTIFALIVEWCPYIQEHLMQKTEGGSYRFNLVRSKTKPKKQPKNIDGLSERDVWASESYNSFGHEDFTPFHQNVTYLDFEMEFELTCLDIGFKYLLSTPALPKEARKSPKTQFEFEFKPLEFEAPDSSSFEEFIPF